MNKSDLIRKGYNLMMAKRKIKIVINLLLLFLFSGLFLVLHKDMVAEKQKKSIYLGIKQRYPSDDDDLYFRAISDMDIKNNLLYAVCNFDHNVLVFSAERELDLVQKIGSQGQGPGEFNLPISISIGKNIAVKDNYGFSIFNSNGGFFKRFKSFSGERGFVIENGKIYWVNTDSKRSHLIEIYSLEGKLIKTIGKKYIDLDLSIHKGISPEMAVRFIFDGELFSDGESLFYLGRTFGKFIEFDLNGNILRELNLVDFLGETGKKLISENRKIWLKQGVDTSKTEGYIHHYEIFSDAFLYNGKIYVMSPDYLPEGMDHHGMITIKSIDTGNLHLIQEYQFHIGEDENPLCFAVKEDENASTPRFFISMVSEDFEIREYN